MKVRMYATLKSRSAETSDGGVVAETETSFTLLQETVPSQCFWGCYFKVKKKKKVT